MSIRYASAASALIFFTFFWIIFPGVGTASTTTSITPASYGTPIRLVIPAIKLDSPIKGMGINSKGELEVPSGKTNSVGWHKAGTVPGQIGSAVLDAHVFAAFAKLKNLKPGNDIYVITSTNQKLHFTVKAAKTYALKDLSPVTLFAQNDARRLNLITCAGSLTKDRSTYDHRLVVYATLA
ncbi:MAG: class sortase [Parcubacteria group bacterium]|nr:class sortase [Parcubacteria group bacterium]